MVLREFSLLGRVKDLWQRKLPTESHQKIWKNFEMILNMRANVCQVGLALMQIVWHANGNSRVQNSKKFIATSDDCEENERVLTLLPYIEWSMIVFGIFGRLLVPIISYWKPEACKVLFGLQTLVIISKETAVIDFGIMWHQFMSEEQILFFILLCNVGKIDLVISIVAQIYLRFILPGLFMEHESVKILPTLFHMACVLSMQAVTYLFINWIGLTYLEAEMPRIDNEHILDQMKEGVIITEEKSYETCFSNQAFRSIEAEVQHECNFSITTQEKTPTLDF